jgi:acetoacetate decarboxylase
MVSYQKNYDIFRSMIKSNPPEPSHRNMHKLRMFYRTTREATQRVLPPPLEAPTDPQGYVYHLYSEMPAYGRPQYESAQFVKAQYQDREGWYLLSNYVETDAALWIGRELYGLPKRMGEVKLVREGNKILGKTSRHGKELITAEMTITREEPHEPFLETWTTKCGMSSEGDLEYAKLICLPYRVDQKESYVGTGEVTYGESDSDPVAELEVVEPLPCRYILFDHYRGPATTLFEFKPEDFYPFLTARMLG